MASQDPNAASGSGKQDDSSKVPPKDSKKKDDKKDEDLSDEDLALKQQLELYVERIQYPDPGLQKVALESMSFYSVNVAPVDCCDAPSFSLKELPIVLVVVRSSAELLEEYKGHTCKLDEDLALKQQLELYVESVQDSDPGVVVSYVPKCKNR